ncbi:hypothetical protein SEVIR_9G378101v4 [Setaria viridis]
MDDIQARTAANGGDGLARYARDPSAGCTVLPLRLRFSLCHGGSGARGCGVYLAPDAADIIKDLVLVNRLKSTLPAGVKIHGADKRLQLIYAQRCWISIQRWKRVYQSVEKERDVVFVLHKVLSP